MQGQMLFRLDEERRGTILVELGFLTLIPMENTFEFFQRQIPSL
jgi:hypothetical protein